MIVQLPLWQFSSTKPLTKYIEHVHLFPQHAVGQWCCVERASGRLLWQHDLLRACIIRGFDSGVIVASDIGVGCFGISLEDGRLLWTSHGSGLWGKFLRLLDFIPGFENEFCDTPDFVTHGKVYCHSGRVLDIATGQTVERITIRDLEAYKRPTCRTEDVYLSSLGTVAINNGLVIYYGADNLRHTESGSTAVETEEKKSLWHLSIQDQGRFVQDDPFSYRLALPYLYLVVSEQPACITNPSDRRYSSYNPTLWHLLTVDVHTGKVLQDFALGKENMADCRIEDVDDHGLLITYAEYRTITMGRIHLGTDISRQELLYFARQF